MIASAVRSNRRNYKVKGNKLSPQTAPAVTSTKAKAAKSQLKSEPRPKVTKGSATSYLFQLNCLTGTGLCFFITGIILVTPASITKQFYYFISSVLCLCVGVACLAYHFYQIHRSRRCYSVDAEIDPKSQPDAPQSAAAANDAADN